MRASVHRRRSPRSRRASRSQAFCGSMLPSVEDDASSRPQRREEYAASLSQADRRYAKFSRYRRAPRTPRNQALRIRECSAPLQDQGRRNAAFRLSVRCRAMCIEFQASSLLFEYRASMHEFVGRAPLPDRVRAASPLRGPSGSDQVTHRRIHALIVLPAPRSPVERCLKTCGSGRC